MFPIGGVMFFLRGLKKGRETLGLGGR